LLLVWRTSLTRIDTHLSETSVDYNSSMMIMLRHLRVSQQIILLAVVLAISFPVAASVVSLTEIQQLVTTLKGDDERLFRWDATEHTHSQQSAGACKNLEEVATLLTTTSAFNDELLAAAADYSLLCITDNPLNRAKLSQVPDIHKAIVDKLIKSSTNTALPALGGHLVYSATYTNEKNHQTFFEQGAVEALAEVIMDDDKTAIPVQKMYAAAALQNLAASYCETVDDGTCYWEWTATDEHIQLDPHSLPLHSDATAIRKRILEIPGLVDELIELACHGPIGHDEENEEDLVMPGSNALADAHGLKEEMVTWAAMATLKNLVLEPTAKKIGEHALSCACLLKESHDWLEEAKAFDFLHHMRRGDDPCFLSGDGVSICIDDSFLDEGYYHCDEYEGVSKEDCEATLDKITGVTAEVACCECGGGLHVDFTSDHDEL